MVKRKPASYISEDEEKRTNQLGNLVPKPAIEKNKRAVTHGGFSYLRTGLVPGCHLCIFTTECEDSREGAKECSMILKMQDDLVASIMSLPHIQDQDIVLVEELARSKTFLWIVDKWISMFGPFKEKELARNKLEAQGILKQRWTAANSMTRIAESLGLSPLARSKLKIEGEGFDFAKAIQEVEERKQ